MKIKIYQINGDRDKNRVKFTRHDLLEKYQGTSAIDASLYAVSYTHLTLPTMCQV